MNDEEKQKLRDLLRKNPSATPMAETFNKIKVDIIDRIEREPENDTTRVGHLTVRRALEIATQLDADGVDRETIYQTLEDKEKSKAVLVKVENEILAEQTMDHFRKSLFEKKMAGVEMSDWSQAMAKFVAVRERVMEVRWLALATTTPGFAAVNLRKSRISQLMDTVPETMNIKFEDWKNEIPKLKFVEKWQEKNRNKDVSVYCFTTAGTQSTYGLILELSNNNPIAIAAWDRLTDITGKGEDIQMFIEGHACRFFGEQRALKITNVKFP